MTTQQWPDSPQTTTESAAIPTLRDDIRGALIASRTGQGSYGPNYDGNKLAEKLEAILAATPALPVPALTDERILTLAAPLMSDGQGFVRKPELFEVVAFAKVIEADLRAALAAPASADVVYQVKQHGWASMWMDASKAEYDACQTEKRTMPVAPTSVPLCPACGGSGEAVQMSDSSPDAYEVPCPCLHCNGEGSLDAAYRGVVARLDAECKASMELAAKLFFAQPAAQVAVMVALLQDAFDTLESTTDSDIDFESDEEEREGAPAQYAARKIMEAICLATTAEQSTDKPAEGL
jgi:hypothetical protein